MEVCEKCGKRKKRFRSAFGSWICDACKVETHVDTPAFNSRVRLAESWWLMLKNDDKLRIFDDNQTLPVEPRISYEGK